MFAVRRAVQEDRESILRLLRQAGVSESGMDRHLMNFLIVEEPVTQRKVGTVGMEVHGDRGLLRSFVMENRAWNAHTGLKLITVVLSFVQQMKLKEIYMLSGISANIFEAFGFEPVKWEDLPREIRQSASARVESSEGVPMVYRNPRGESIRESDLGK